MSISQQLMDAINDASPQERKTLDPVELQKRTGYASGKISKLLWSLEHTGRIKLIRDGRSIVGIDDVLRYETEKPGPRTNGVRRARKTDDQAIRNVRTPNLSRYQDAKDKANSLTADDEWIEVTFRENPLAEEGLRLREQLAQCQKHFDELSVRYKVVYAEYEGVKQRMKSKVEADVYKQIAERQPED